MKARRTILSVLTALFMVASLCAVAAAPAGAATAQNGKATINSEQPIDFTVNGNAIDETEGAVEGHGNVGDVVSLGISYNSSVVGDEQAIHVYWDGEEVDAAPSPLETVDKTSGIHTTTGSFEVPDSEHGGHDIKVAIGPNSRDPDNDEYKVNPKVRISDNKDVKGSTETVTCTGFEANYSIDVYAVKDANSNGRLCPKGKDTWNKVGSGTTDDTGTAEVSCTMDYESFESGKRHEKGWIAAIDGTGLGSHPSDDNLNADSDGYTFEPKITLDPTSGPTCDTVTVSASEFTNDNTSNLKKFTIAGEDINPYEGVNNLNEVNYKEDDLEPSKWITTSAYDKEDAEFEVKFQVPADLSAGAKKVYLKTNAGEDASATFTVGKATMEIDPTEGPEGQTVAVTCTGLAAGKDDYYDLKFVNKDTSVVKKTKKDLDTDSEGKLSTSFEVPSDIESDQDFDVKLVRNGGEVVSATFHKIEESLSISPEKGPAGTEVQVTGKGLPASDNFSIAFDDTVSKRVLANVATDSLGKFTTTVTIPSDAAIATGEIYIPGEDVEHQDFKVTAAKPLVKVQDGLSDIWSSVDKSVWYYDNSSKTWKQYYKANPSAVPEAKRLESMKAGASYWVHVTKDCTLKYGGHVYNLRKGWNSIGWVG